MVQKNIIWQGLDTYQTLENCMITRQNSGYTISSTVVGVIDGQPFKVDYILHTDTHWRVSFFDLNYIVGHTLQKVQYVIDDDGNWFNKGIEDPLLSQCTTVDISVTPFTNTLAIKRLKLLPGQSQEITVLYVDIIEREMKVTNQLYTCIDALNYRFETTDGGFVADISFDESGFVTEYPGLFKQLLVV